MRDDERQRVLVLRTSADEMDVLTLDLCYELRYRVQLCPAFAPIVVGRPVACQRLSRPQLHALRVVGNQFPFGPPHGVYASAQFDKFRFRNVQLRKRVNTACIAAGLSS